ncbi:unnamed protein product, partial [Medioppia subpectinata]
MNAHKQLFSDLAIRICTITVFIIGLNHQHQNAANGCKLDITIHIQLLCNHSRAIVIEQAIPAWRRLSSIMNLELIPYGNSRTLIGNYSMLPPPQMAFKCQHGNRECSGNALMGCALKTLPKEYGIAFVDCMFRHDLWWKPEISAPCCARQLDIDWRFLERCSQSAFGKNIQWLNGRKVHALRPKMRHVPWGYKPDICNETIVEKVVPTRLGFTKRNASVEAIVLTKNQTILPNIPNQSHASGPGIATNYTLPVPDLKVINASVVRDIMLQSKEGDDCNHQATTIGRASTTPAPTTTPHIRINESADTCDNKTTGADDNRTSFSVIEATVPTTTPCGPVNVVTTTPCGPVNVVTTTPCGPVIMVTTTPCGPVPHGKSGQLTSKPEDFDLDEFEDARVDRNQKQSNLTSGPTTVRATTVTSGPTVTKSHVTTYAQSSSSLVDNGVVMVQKTINATTNPRNVNNTAFNSTNANDKPTSKSNCTVGGGDDDEEDKALKSSKDEEDEEESAPAIQRIRPDAVRNESSQSNKTDPNVRIHLKNLIPHNQSTTALPNITTTTKTTTTLPTTTTTPRVTTTTPKATTRVTTTTPTTTTRVTTTTSTTTTRVTTTPTTTTRVTTTPTTTTTPLANGVVVVTFVVTV